MSTEKSSNSAARKTQHRYDIQSQSRPILEIITSRNGEIISENTVFRTLTPKHTNTGDHVLKLAYALA